MQQCEIMSHVSPHSFVYVLINQFPVGRGQLKRTLLFNIIDCIRLENSYMKNANENTVHFLYGLIMHLFMFHIVLKATNNAIT